MPAMYQRGCRKAKDKADRPVSFLRVAGLALCLAGCAARGEAETVARQVARSYDAVDTLRCEVRRERELPDGSALRILSRVAFKRPNLLNVETVSPRKRRVVSDGVVCRDHAEGASKGLMTPLAELPPHKRAELHRVPGTVTDTLAALDGAKEVRLPPLPEWPVRAGYDMGVSFTVLSLDPSNRLARLEVFADASQSILTAHTDFSAFREVLPGAWFATLQRSVMTVDGRTVTETVRLGNVVANRDVPDSMFDASRFFEGVTFETDAGKAVSRAGDAPGGSRAAEDGGRRGKAAGRPALWPARAVIALYRSQLSPAIGQRCSLTPSCSEYFLQALDAAGPLAVPMIADRLVREPVVYAARATPVTQPDGRILFADPVCAHLPSCSALD